MPAISTVPFREIPHQSKLFLDYLDLSPKALSFYGRAPTLENLERAAREDLSRIMTIPRREVAAILRRQNESYGATFRVMGHIDDLEHSDSVAVVTGQQVGLFTGPLYTIYKAFTAIRISEELRKRGIRAVPVFWMDSEDHDLAEVTHVTILGPDSVPRKVDYRPLLFADGRYDQTTPAVGTITFQESVYDVVNDYLSLVAGSRWESAVRSQLQLAYRPGTTFAECFGRLMSNFFGDRGLVMFDPQDHAAKALVYRVFQKAVQDAGKIYDALLERNQQLDAAGYHTQVHVPENSSVLFIYDEGERKALTRRGEGFALKNSGQQFTEEELVRLAERVPECFSPNVLLRPLIQDHLFPTVGYVGGPSEVAYFAQIQVLYQLFGRPMPAIWPRASLTFLDQEVGAELARARLVFEDCFEGKHHVVEKLITRGNHSNANDILKELQEVLVEGLTDIRPGMEAADSSLGPAVETARRKILHQIENLQTKFVHVEARHNRKILEKAEFLLNHCYPNKNLQERELSVHYLLARHGPHLMDDINTYIIPERFAHQVVILDIDD